MDVVSNTFFLVRGGDGCGNLASSMEARQRMAACKKYIQTYLPR